MLNVISSGVWKYPTQQHLWLFIFYLCFLVFLYLSLSDVGMLRFQTSEALWDRSSVSAGSVTVSLYQLQCLVEVWVFPKLCFFFYNILFYYVFCFRSALTIVIIIIFTVIRTCFDNNHKWMDRWTDGWETDGMLLSLELVLLPMEEDLFVFFQSIKRLLWLFNCLCVTFYPSPQQLWIKSPVWALSLSSLSLSNALSRPISVVCRACYVHHASG